MASASQAIELQSFGAPAQGIRGPVNEMFWDNAARGKALCTMDTLAGVVGSSLTTFGGFLTAYGAQALYHDQREWSAMLLTGGAFLTGAVGFVMTRQGILSGVESIRDANRIILEKKRIDRFNHEMTSTAKKETILIAIDSRDHNGGLAIDEFVAQVGPWAQNYSIHAVLVENPSDWDRACKHLETQGKVVKHVLFAAHGTVLKVELGGKSVREYLTPDKRRLIPNLERCLFWSCSSGVADGEANMIARQNPDIELWAPSSVADTGSSFLDLDSSGKPTILQFSRLDRLIITNHYKGGKGRACPIESERIRELCKRNRNAENCVTQCIQTLTQEGGAASRATLEVLISTERLIRSAVETLPEIERDAFAVQVRRLIAPDMDDPQIIEIIDMLKRMRANEWEAFADQALRLITQDTDAMDRIGTYEILSKKPANDRKAFADQALRLITQSADEMDRKGIYHILSNKQASEWEAFVDQVLRLTLNMCDNQRMDSGMRLCYLLIGELGAMQPNELKHYVDQVLRVIPKGKNEFKETLPFLRILLCVKASEREEFGNRALRLVPLNISSRERIGFVTILIRMQLNLNECERIEVFEAIEKIPETERCQRFNRVAKQLTTLNKSQIAAGDDLSLHYLKLLNS